MRKTIHEWWTFDWCLITREYRLKLKSYMNYQWFLDTCIYHQLCEYTMVGIYFLDLYHYRYPPASIALKNPPSSSSSYAIQSSKIVNCPMIFPYFSYHFPVGGTSCHISAGAPRHRPPPAPFEQIGWALTRYHQCIEWENLSVDLSMHLFVYLSIYLSIYIYIYILYIYIYISLTGYFRRDMWYYLEYFTKCNWMALSANRLPCLLGAFTAGDHQNSQAGFL